MDRSRWVRKIFFTDFSNSRNGGWWKMTHNFANNRSGALDLELPKWTENINPLPREHVKTTFTPQVSISIISSQIHFSPSHFLVAGHKEGGVILL
jgi:hypothetical protein